MKVGLLTGGGDCPGLNTVIRAIVRKGLQEYKTDFVAIYNGWKGMINNEIGKLSLDDISGILPRGGTILGTSRANPYKMSKGENIIKDNYRKLGLDALIVIGGMDTLSVAVKLFKAGINIIGVPKTIDNDIAGTEFTFGFQTAVQIATEAIDRLHSTAESHHRVIVCEVMGRETGWIAIYSGIAGGADVILIPEEPFDIQDVCKIVKTRTKRGKNFSIVVVAEGAKPKHLRRMPKHLQIDAFGHPKYGGIGHAVAKEITRLTGYETRTSILGYIQRGGSPNAYDRVLATRYGVCAIDLAQQKKYGKMVSLQADKIVPVDIEGAVKLKRVSHDLFETAKIFFG